MSILKNTNHKKYSDDWNKFAELLVTVALDKDETDDTKKKSKQLEKLLEERGKTEQEKAEAKKEITAKENKIIEIRNSDTHLSGAQREKRRLSGADRGNDFLTSWQSGGYTAKSNKFFNKSFSDGKYDNLYKLKVGNTELETTEEQIINTVAKVVKSLENIDKADFVAKYKAKDGDATNQTFVDGYIDTIKAQAKEIIVGSNANNKQATYDFSFTYQNEAKGKMVDDVWVPNTEAYNQPQFNYADFWRFVNLVHDKDFLNDLDAEKQKEVPKTAEWTINLKGKKWEQDSKHGELGLKDAGINIDPNKISLYKTSSTKKKEFRVVQGIKGWLNLAHVITQDNTNRQKLNANLGDSDNVNQLIFTDGKADNLPNLPESANSLEEIITDLEYKKSVSYAEIANINKEITEKEKTITEKDATIIEKEAKVEEILKEAVTKFRENLTELKLEDGFDLVKKADGTIEKDNRREYIELQRIQNKLLEIRYFVNKGDTTNPTGEAIEDDSYQKIDEIIEDERTRRYWNVVSVYQDYWLENDKDDDKTAQFIKQDPYLNLDWYLNAFVGYEELFKLTDDRIKIKEALEKAKGKKPDKPPMELKEYTNKLKELDAKLETAFTDTEKTEWEKIDNFKEKPDKIKTLLETPKKTGATVGEEFKEFFTKIKEGKEAFSDVKDMDDFEKLIKKSPEIIIKVIRYYEYENLSDTGDTDKDKKKTQQTRRILKALDLGKDHTLSNDEIKTALYKHEIGEKKLEIDKFFKEDLTEYTEDKKDSPNTEKPAWYAWGGYFPIWGTILAIGGICIYAYWDKISSLWSDKPEEDKGILDDDE